MNFEEYLDSLLPALRSLKFDPSATVFYDLMSGALVWTDEKLFEGLTPEQMGCLRAIFRYRTSLLEGTPDKRFENLWNLLVAECPEWIGFNPSRRAPTEDLLAQYRRLKTRRGSH
jgi:hypothetical protein